MRPHRSAAPVARPLAPLAAVLVVAVTAHAVLVGCGGSNQSSENSTTTPPPSNSMSTDTGGTNAVPAGAGDVVLGEKIYKQRCVLCHGPEGKGNGPGAAALNPKPRDHTNAAYMNTQTDEQLLHSIREGKGQMPAWGKVLTEAEMHAVLAYVRTLSKK